MVHTPTTRSRVRISRSRGRLRSIVPDRARDDDLGVFLSMSKLSRRAIAAYLDNLLGPA